MNEYVAAIIKVLEHLEPHRAQLEDAIRTAPTEELRQQAVELFEKIKADEQKLLGELEKSVAAAAEKKAAYESAMSSLKGQLAGIPERKAALDERLQKKLATVGGRRRIQIDRLLDERLRQEVLNHYFGHDHGQSANVAAIEWQDWLNSWDPSREL